MSREERPGRASQLAVDALQWAASDSPRPPDSIAHLSTTDQAAIARAAQRVVAAVQCLADRHTSTED